MRTFWIPARVAKAARAAFCPPPLAMSFLSQLRTNVMPLGPLPVVAIGRSRSDYRCPRSACAGIGGAHCPGRDRHARAGNLVRTAVTRVRVPPAPWPASIGIGPWGFFCFLGCFVVVNLSVVGVVRPRAAGRVRPSFPRLVTGTGPCYSFVAGYLN